MSAYYNEFDPKAAAWLRELIKAGLIAPGYVDERSITEVNPYEIRHYTQHHFFAGIGGWSYALRLAGWPDDKPVVTGSCPCQPFSQAGKGLGEEDERHLWPVLRDIVTHLGASTVFGEQVASAAGRIWLSRVRLDLEALGYAVGASDLCAAGVGSPHIRQRLYWMANANSSRTNRNKRGESFSRSTRGAQPCSRGAIRDFGLDDANGKRGRGGITGSEDAANARLAIQTDAPPELDYWMGNSDQPRPQRRRIYASEHGNQRTPWATSELIDCTDGKARRVEPGTFPLAHGVSGRVGLLRGYGNAIVPQVAAEFIQAAVEAIGGE